ncbi:MAG: hypothetical protein ACXADA_14795 [Candidatus Hodarchaeales archaeon]|jgi:hypothetical protein
MNSRELENLKEESSRFVTEAITQKARGKIEEAKCYFQKASEKSIQIAMQLDKNQAVEAIAYWISAANCALDSENITVALNIVADLDERNEQLLVGDVREIKEINKRAMKIFESQKMDTISKDFILRIIRWISYTLESKFGKIGGKGVIMKILFDLRQKSPVYGFFIDVPYYVNRYPIYSRRIDEILENYLDSKFFYRNSDKSINLTTIARKMVQQEIDFTEKMIRKTFSNELFEELQNIVVFLGDKSSKELMEIEMKEGITPYQIGRPLS